MRIVFTALVSILLFGQITAQDSLPANMYRDTMHAPFFYGVASGDPLKDAVIIWTHITPVDSTIESLEVNWEMASDIDFANMVQSGGFTTTADRDWTVKIDVRNLEAGQTYYYRFSDEEQRYSVVGRTKTAPEGSTNQLKAVVASCSSVYSGFFNAYRRIAERDDLDFVVHLGDYIYDFVDEDEQIRVPSPYPTVPSDTFPDEWRDRHEYYLTDPDFRAARQMHPFIIIWDNHDVDRREPGFAIQAFREWTPTRLVDSTDATRIYRSFSYGDLLDLYFMDIWLFRNQDTLENGGRSVLGLEQYEWLTNSLKESTARWRIIGNQKMFSLWSASEVPPGSFPVDGEVFTRSTWDGYMEEREKFLTFIQDNAIDNLMILSGDAHISMAMDLVIDPKNPETYNPATGEGGLGVEFLPTSISRGNLDEQGVEGIILDIALSVSQAGNPHHVYSEFTKHGYGLLDIQKDSIAAEYWYSDILEMTAIETMERRLVFDNGFPFWRRGANPPVSTRNLLPEGYTISEVYPNPTSGIFSVDLNFPKREAMTFSIFDGQWRLVKQFNRTITPNTNQREEFQMENPGYYWLVMHGKGFKVGRLVLVK